MTLLAPEHKTLIDRARCPEVGAEWFFADDEDRERPSMYQAAKKVCNTCPVADLCLSLAMDYEGDSDRHNRSGVWGGMTPSERAELRDDWAGSGFNRRNAESTS